MKKTICFVLTLLCVSLTGCGAPDAPIDEKSLIDEPVTFVPIKYVEHPSFAIDGSCENLTYKCDVEFTDKCNLQANIVVNTDEKGVSFDDDFKYECTEEQADMLQVIYGAWLKSADCPELVSSDLTADMIDEMHDSFELAIIYTMVAFDTNEMSGANRFLKEVYGDALMFY